MTHPSLPRIGAPDYLPSLLAALSAYPSLAGWSPPPELFSLILLALVVGKGGVIVDLQAEDNGAYPAKEAKGRKSRRRKELAGVVGVVQAILGGISGKETRHVALSPQSTPTDLVDALLFHPAPPTGHSHTIDTSKSDVLRPPIKAAQSHLDAEDRSTELGKTKSRLSLFTTTSATSTTATSAYVSAPSSPLPPSPNPGELPTSAIPSLLPSPMPSRSPSPSASHGLSYHTARHVPTHIPSRRDSSLPATLICTGLESADPTVLTKMVDFLRTSRVRSEGADPNPTGGRGYDPTTRGWEGCIVWVREEGCKTPGWLTDQFLLSLSISPSSLDTPPATLLTPQTPLETHDDPHLDASPLPHSVIQHLRSLLPFMHIHPPLMRHLTNLSSALNVHPRLKLVYSGQGAAGLAALVKAARVLRGDLALPEGWERGCRERERLAHYAGGNDGLSIGHEHGTRGSKTASLDDPSGLGIRGGTLGEGGLEARKFGGRPLIAQSAKARERRHMDSWGIKAGEEPRIASLWRPQSGRAWSNGVGQADADGVNGDKADGRQDGTWAPYGQTPEHGTPRPHPRFEQSDTNRQQAWPGDAEDETDSLNDLPRPDFADPYCSPTDLQAVWFSWARHRCSWREGRGEVLWLVNPARGERATLGLGVSKGERAENVSVDKDVRAGRKEGVADEVRRVEGVLREVWGVV